MPKMRQKLKVESYSKEGVKRKKTFQFQRINRLTCGEETSTCTCGQMHYMIWKCEQLVNLIKNMWLHSNHLV